KNASPWLLTVTSLLAIRNMQGFDILAHFLPFTGVQVQLAPAHPTLWRFASAGRERGVCFGNFLSGAAAGILHSKTDGCFATRIYLQAVVAECRVRKPVTERTKYQLRFLVVLIVPLLLPL